MKTLLSLILLAALPVEPAPRDRDRDGDGVSDRLERELIETFRPEFLLDTEECADRPAEFEPMSVIPRVREVNGTIYARVSPSTALGRGRRALEVQYFHLWERDCGPFSPHPLDVEHVTALIVPETIPETGSPDAGGYHALYWYAAAHEGTMCDTSSAARAEAIAASDRGPRVWISKGKHASYFSHQLCRQRGCGVDGCGESRPMPLAGLVNLGERSEPLNGAVWTASRDWPLADKLGSDFDTAVLARLEESDRPMLARINGNWRPVQFTVSIAKDIAGSAGKAGQQGGEGLLEAEEQTASALGKTLRAVGRALGQVARALGLASQESKEEKGS